MTARPVRWMDFDPETYEFPEDAPRKVLTGKTRLVALGLASNCTGTVNNVKHFASEARAAGALVYVDAVQFAPHYAIEPVARMGLMDKGGVLRAGLAHYNTEGEVDALLSSLTRITKA